MALSFFFFSFLFQKTFLPFLMSNPHFSARDCGSHGYTLFIVVEWVEWDGDFSWSYLAFFSELLSHIFQMGQWGSCRNMEHPSVWVPARGRAEPLTNCVGHVKRIRILLGWHIYTPTNGQIISFLGLFKSNAISSREYSKISENTSTL